MAAILENISPVFIVIALGFLSRRLGFLPDTFIGSANRLVYFVAIPILVYSEISRGSFSESFNIVQIADVFAALAMTAVVVLILARALALSPGGAATFAQASFHSNLGYVGLAVVFYSLGTEGRAAASVLAGFIMLFQNFLAIGIYTFVAREHRKLDMRTAGRFVGNPIILATLLGLGSSAAEIRLPGFVDRSFDIVAHMALPLALLIIGGSLKTAPAKRIQLVAVTTVFKLIVLPLTGLLLFRASGLDVGATLIGVILLSSPSATLSYVMASEMGGKPDFAAAAVTTSTVLSLLSYTLWISVIGG
ncbi:MAG: AEC family transporter [bacterium]|nr:AEC family transporter [bacterium]MDT8394924.1 AEC family transporter [bacterium]